MNLFLIDAYTTSSLTSFGDRILNLISTADDGKKVCLLAGYDTKSRSCADSLKSVFTEAEIICTHLVNKNADFEDLCLRSEILLERMKSGSLSEFDTIVALLSKDSVRSVMQSAFFMDKDVARGIQIPTDKIRFLSLCGSHFYDFGYLPDADPTASVTSDYASADPSASTERQIHEEEISEEKRQMIRYYEEVKKSADTAKFLQETNKKINRIQSTVEQNKILWGNQFLNPGNDCMRDNDLLLLCIMMKEIARSIDKQALQSKEDRLLDAHHDTEHSLYGISTENNISNSNGQSKQGYSQNSK